MKRSQYLDVFKGFTAFLVVLGHCIQYGSGSAFLSSDAFFDNWLFKLIYTFHMAAFITVSGYLFYFSVKKHSTVELLKRRCMSTLIPILFWSQFSIIVKLATGDCKFNGIVGFIKDDAQEIISTLWFLWALLFCSIALLIISKIKIKWLRIVVIVALVCSFFVIPDNLNLKYFKFLFPSFLSGFLFAKYNGPEKIKKLSNAVKYGGSIALLLLFAVMYLFFDKEKYIYTTGVSVLGKNIPMQMYNDIYRWVIGILGTACFAIVVAVIYNLVKWQKARNLVASVGKRSLGVYIISLEINSFVLIPFTKRFSPNIGLWLLETIIIISVCCFVTWLIERTKPTKLLMLGSK